MEKSKRISCVYQAIKDNILNGDFSQNKHTYTFPPVENIDTKENKSIWIISVTAFDKNKNVSVPIKTEYIKCPVTQPTNNIVAKINTKIRRHTDHVQTNDETIVEEGKNLGKRNATTSISQAILEAYRKYINKSRIANVGNKINDIRPLPMLLKKSGATSSTLLTDNDFRKGVAIQPKIDGIRAIAHLLGDNTVEFYSRKGFAFQGLDLIASEVCKMLIKQNKYDPKNLYLDGELHTGCNNTPLQEISGAVRGENNDQKNRLKFYIFDCFVLGNENLIQKDRLDIIDKLCNNKNKYALIVKSIIVHSEEELQIEYNNYIKEGYEGAVSRRLDGKYKFGVGTQRSSDVTKIKPVSRDEFEIIGFKEGRGRDKGAITYILKNTNNIEFSAVPNMTLEERKKLYSSLIENPSIFKKQYKNKFATIEHVGLSNKNVPLQPKFIDIRYD